MHTHSHTAHMNMCESRAQASMTLPAMQTLTQAWLKYATHAMAQARFKGLIELAGTVPFQC